MAEVVLAPVACKVLVDVLDCVIQNVTDRLAKLPVMRAIFLSTLMARSCYCGQPYW